MRTLRQKIDGDMAKMATFSEKGKDEDQSSGVLGRHPDTRAESTISISLKAISAVERTDSLPWVDLGVGEDVAGTGIEEERRKFTKMRQKRVPSARKCVENVYP